MEICCCHYFYKLYNVYRANLTLYNPLRAASMSRQDYIDHKKCQVHEFPSKNVIVYARGDASWKI